MTVLFVAEVGHVGGATTAIEEIANEMVNHGVEVIVVQGRDREGQSASREYLDPRIHTYFYTVDFRCNVRVFVSMFLHLWALLSLVRRKYAIDTVYINYAYSGGIISVHPLYRKTRKAFLFHGDEPKIMWSMVPTPKKHAVLGWAKRVVFSGPFIAAVWLGQRIALRSSSVIVAFSRYTETTLVENLGVDPERIRRIPLGVNRKTFYPPHDKAAAKRTIGHIPTVPILLCTSRFEERKGILFLLKVFSYIHKQFPSAVLYLATPADSHYLASQYYHDVQEQICLLQISAQVRVVYNLTRRQLVPYYQAADVYVFPSKMLEAFGLVALESLSSGVPVVCYGGAGAPREIVSQLSPKLVFSEYVPRKMATCIRYALKIRLHKNPTLFNRMRAISRRYNWSSTTRALLDI